MPSRIDSLFKKKININLEFVDIKAVLNEIGISYSESGKNVSKGWIGVNCPFPGCGDHSNHLGINLHSPVVTCYNCGNKGNYLTYLALKLNSWKKAVEILQKYSPRELRIPYEKIQSENHVQQVYLPETATKKALPEQIEYLKFRGYSDYKKLEKLYDFYYCENDTHWGNRIIIPVYYQNRLVTFTSIDPDPDSKLRYNHLKKEESIFHCKQLLYGEEQITNRSVIMVVEGFFDKVKIGPGCICTFGTLVTSEQKRKLINYKNVIVTFDGDEPGQINGTNLARDLSAFTEVQYVKLPEGIDPDKLSDKDVKELKNLLKKKW